MRTYPQYTLYNLRESLLHLLVTRVPSCEEPGSAHEKLDNVVELVSGGSVIHGAYPV